MPRKIYFYHVDFATFFQFIYAKRTKNKKAKLDSLVSLTPK
jgi:hypothetical protein